MPSTADAVAPARTREEWFLRVIEVVRPKFAEAGAPIPEKVRLATGFPVDYRRSRGNVLAECWSPEVSTGGWIEIFVSPAMGADHARVFDVVVHELVHAAVGNAEGHRGRFKTVAEALGLTGPMTATKASDALRAWIVETAMPAVGPYPHDPMGEMMILGPDGIPVPVPPGAPLPPGAFPKGRRPDPRFKAHPPQSTRLVKCDCPACGYTVRLTRKWIAVAVPTCPDPKCPAHGKPFHVGPMPGTGPGGKEDE